MKIIDRYIFLELVKICAVCLFFLMAVLTLEKVNFLFSITQGSFVSAGELLRLIAYFLPAFMVISIPLATLLSSLVVFSQLSADNEITALRSCGVGYPRILLPVLMFSLLSWLLSLHLSLAVQHEGKYRFMTLLTSLVGRKISATLEERVFFDRLPDTVIYVNEKTVGGDALKGVFIYDRSNPARPRFITASGGTLSATEDRKGIALKLQNGSVYSGDADSYRTVSYGEYEFLVDIGPDRHAFEKGEREMSVEEIKKRIAGKRERGAGTLEDEVELNRRYSLPAACLVLGLLGAALGTRIQRGGRWGGVSAGIAMIVANYVLFMMAEGIGKGGVMAPAAAMWLPNILLGGLSLLLIYRGSRETMPFGATIFLQSLRLRAGRRFAGR